MELGEPHRGLSRFKTESEDGKRQGDNLYFCFMAAYVIQGWSVCFLSIYFLNVTCL